MKHNSKGYVYNVLHSWLGSGLLTSEGDKWQKRRKVLTPSFHFNILQEFIEIFNEETENLVKVIKKESYKPYIAITDYISDFTLNSIAETAMGYKFDKKKVSGKNYKKALYDIGEIYVYRLCHSWLLYNFLYIFVPHFYKEKFLVKTLHNFTNDVIVKREQNFKPIEQKNTHDFCYSKRRRLAMLDLLLTAKKEENSIDDKGIREEVDTFMFEGHDTTSVGICYTLLLLASHRNIQVLQSLYYSSPVNQFLFKNRIYDEIEQILPNSTKPNYQSLHDLKYMERCIKETLRIYPSVPFIARILGEDITTYDGYKIKAGSEVNLHIYDVHHNPDIYPDPEKFDPDRFLPENCQNRHTFAYVPFSAGPRNCIGQKFAILEMKAVLCGLLKEFILEPVDTPDSIVPIVDLVLRTKDCIRIKFIPRQ